MVRHGKISFQSLASLRLPTLFQRSVRDELYKTLIFFMTVFRADAEFSVDLWVVLELSLAGYLQTQSMTHSVEHNPLHACYRKLKPSSSRIQTTNPYQAKLGSSPQTVA